MNTYDCEPTLTDTQVLEFCKQGFLMLEGVVPDEINHKAFEYLEEHTEHGCSVGSIDGAIENVLLNPHATGAIRSLLGKNFTVPPDLYGPGNQIKCPMPAGPWHVDGGAVFGPQLDCLQVFYIPQDTPRELGPTDVLPGSHFLIADGIPSMAHYGSIRGAVSTTGPAGSIFLTAYPMWHRRGASTAKGVRNLLKYSYKRTVPPERDWIREPDFQPRRAKDAPPRLKFHREHQRAIYDAAEMFYWLCGKHSEYHSTSRNNFPVHHAS
jgi:hypothetical protein